MSAYARLSDIAPLPIWTGVLARAVQGAHVTLAVVELSPDSAVPEHAHANEQLGIVLQGSLVFTIGGERRELVAGDTYYIPGNVPHAAAAGPAGCVAVDVFSPVRADWAKFEPGPPRPPAWP
jgi:quercetin dioxygenase-like cupin family protein